MQQPSLPPLFEFTPVQLSLLTEQLQQLTNSLAEFHFNDPANDELLIRQHAALSGQRTQLLTLLGYDEAAKEKFADEQEQRLFNPLQPE